VLIKHQTYKGEATRAAGLAVLRNESILRKTKDGALSALITAHRQGAWSPDPGIHSVLCCELHAYLNLAVLAEQVPQLIS
jgi:hypothetical protein